MLQTNQQAQKKKIVFKNEHKKEGSYQSANQEQKMSFFFQTDKGLYGISEFSRPFKSSIEIQEKFNNFGTTFYLDNFYGNHCLCILRKFGCKS